MSDLVILRHGESTWNQLNLFTGWRDVDLTAKGADEARDAGITMREAGLRFDVVHTSLLVRAVRTADLALDELGQLWLPVNRSWRLNERHYGALQGKDKKQTTAEYDVRPPSVTRDNAEHPSQDPRYRLLPPDVLPGSECLADVVVRVLPYWHDVVVPQLRAGLTVLIVAHGNSLRALVKHLEGIADDAIAELNIPTGVPRRYELDDDLRPTFAGYLGDPEAIAAAADAVSRQAAGT
jgi:2,3-bisphosphoglycerate-dependent phosphoglycerate mutase